MWTYWLLCTIFMTVVHAKPHYLFPKAQLKNEIRPANCTSKKTGEIGTCMFAQKCNAAKGIHLDTCIDRFFMGSCCRLNPKPISNEISYGSTKPTIASWRPSTTSTSPRPETETFISIVTSSSVHLASTVHSSSDPPTTPSTTTISTTTTSSTTTTPSTTTTSSTTTTPSTTTTAPTTTTTPSTTTTAPTTTTTAPITTTTTQPPTTNQMASTAEATTFNPDKLSEMDYAEACGRQMVRERPSGRIVNGQKAEFGEWPWQISLRQWKRTTFMHKCGAALLGENWAITAAHCIDGVPVEDLLLRIGEYDLSSERESSRHVERRVQIMATHPDFNSRTFENDLAMLRFYEPITFRENIIPICLPPDNATFVNRTGYVTGWGRLYVDGPLPNILQEVAVPIITNSDCEQQYRKAGFLESIPEIFLCAGYDAGGRDSCEGDSGGPLVVKGEDERWSLAGVISWGIGCAEPHQPGVYTRISKFKDWIEDILRF